MELCARNGYISRSLLPVAAYSATDAWVVGSTIAVGGSLRPTVLHWDGSNWSGVSVPNFGDGYHEAYGVAAISSNEAWVVGGLNQAYGFVMRCVVGVGCTQSPTPYPGSDYSPLRSVAVVSPNIAWAVGEWNNGIAHTLADLYSDPCGTPPPTSTPRFQPQLLQGCPLIRPLIQTQALPAQSPRTQAPQAQPPQPLIHRSLRLHPPHVHFNLKMCLPAVPSIRSCAVWFARE